MIRRGSLLLLMVVGLTATGCGDTLHPVSGVVKLDGAPVAGAKVTFVSDNGGASYSAPTDANGVFQMMTGEKPGIVSGNYKVVVTKYPNMAGMKEGMAMGDGDYMDMMKKSQKTAEKNSNTSLTPKSGGPMKMIPGSTPGGSSGPKSELPSMYASVSSTPVNCAVPVQNSPFTIELKADDKAKAKPDDKAKPK